MPKKAFQVQVELHVNSISCPGVWLCPHGKLSLQIYMLDSCIQTVSLKPIFPLLFNEKFSFYKTFFEAQRLTDIQKILNNEYLYAELIQWDNVNEGNVLSSFQSTLAELLYPSKGDGVISGVDIDLLMQPVKTFPGILSPKIEVYTKTTIEDKVCIDSTACESWVVNTKVVPSQKIDCNFRETCGKQKKVCHSTAYHRSRKCFPKVREEKPTFAVRRVDDDLILRKPKGLGGEKCDCCDQYRCVAALLKDTLPIASVKTVYEPKPKFNAKCLQETVQCTKGQPCFCGGEHALDNCPVCAKYKYYFDEHNTLKSKELGYCNRLVKTTVNCFNNLETRAHNFACDFPRLTISTRDENEQCDLCTPRKSLAEKMHERLQRSLRLYSDDTHRENYSCDGENSCRCPGSNVGNFYKNFYNKSKTTCEKYLNSSCCT